MSDLGTAGDTNNESAVARSPESDGDRSDGFSWSRRHTFISALAALVVAASVVAIALARFDPLTSGSSFGPARSSADAWMIDSWLEHDFVIVARAEPAATMTLTMAIYNRSARDIVVLDPQPALEARDFFGCWWNPIEVEFFEEPGIPTSEVLAPPFTLPAHSEVGIRVTGIYGEPDRTEPCHQGGGIGSREAEVDLRYRVYGIARTTTVALGTRIGYSDEPENWLQPLVEPIELSSSS